MALLQALMVGGSVLGSLLGGNQQAKAAKQAAAIQAQARRDASAAIDRGVSDASAIYLPYANEGAQSRNLLNSLYGVGGGPTAVDDPQAVQSFLDLIDGKIPNPTPGQQQLLNDYRASGASDPVAWHNQVFGQSSADSMQAARKAADAGLADSPLYKQANDYSGRINALADKYGADASGMADKFSQDSSAAAGKYGSDLTAGADKFSGDLTAGAEQYAGALDSQAKQYANDIWFPTGGRTTYADSPWAGIADRATKQANDSFLNLAGADGSALSGRTARGLQENQANINDKMFGQYLDNFNTNTNNINASNVNALNLGYGARTNAQTAGYGARTNAQTLGYGAATDARNSGYDARSGALDRGFTGKANALNLGYDATYGATGDYINGLNGIATRGYNADASRAGLDMTGAQYKANALMGIGDAQARGVQGAADARTNALQGVGNALMYGAGLYGSGAKAAKVIQPKMGVSPITMPDWQVR